MKKYFLLIALTAFIVTQLTFALVIKTKSVPPYAPTSTPGEFGVRKGTSTATTTPSGIYKACVGRKVQELTKEMQNKKKQALSKFKEAYKNATTTEAKREVRKTYNQEIKEINKWFNQEVRRVKTECKQLRVPTSTPTTTPTTTTSTQQ
ncbi:MAG: hypothetical protein QW367_01185 [Candidatus Aenigmatarchaeota archaeon]